MEGCAINTTILKAKKNPFSQDRTYYSINLLNKWQILPTKFSKQYRIIWLKNAAVIKRFRRRLLQQHKINKYKHETATLHKTNST
jgi:hypothetical protein